MNYCLALNVTWSLTGMTLLIQFLTSELVYGYSNHVLHNSYLHFECIDKSNQFNKQFC